MTIMTITKIQYQTYNTGSYIYSATPTDTEQDVQIIAEADTGLTLSDMECYMMHVTQLM